MEQFHRTLFLLLICIIGIEARNKSPLLDEDGTRIRNKAAECVFGKQVRELGSTWIPDLGPPIGVLYCMRCECVKIQRKRRIVARVQCRSIKNECPEITCEEPVLLPGRCCKSCPGDTYNPETVQDIIPQNVIDDDEKGIKHFAALLTGRSSLVMKNDFQKLVPNDHNKNNVVATGRLTFHKKNLFYSFYVSDKAARPRQLQFVDNDGNILEEFSLSRAGGLVNSVYQNATRKICGVWRRLPREYRKLLKQERMYAVLVWGVKDQAEFTLSGQLKKYSALNTELFSSLLEPAPGTNSLMMSGAGGTAIIYSSISVSPSIHIAIIFNGLFLVNEINDIPLNITLSVDEKKLILQENVYVQKPSAELNMVEIRSPVTPAELRLLTRGRLLISISSVSKPEMLKLTGSVVTKATCELFQTNLASSDNNANENGTSGLAWLYLNNEGSLVYNVQVENLKRPQRPFFLTLVDVSTKRRTELEDLTPSFVNGWANGTIDKLSPKVLEPLYNGNLAVNIATESNSNFISGKLVAKPVADARDSPAPFLLKRENYTLPPSSVGLAWISVDDECHLHYDVSVSDIDANERKLLLHFELLPMLAPGAPVIHKPLEEFQGNQVEGSPIESLTKEELNRLDSGVCFLKVKDMKTKSTLLSATVRQINVPASCRSPYSDNNLPAIISDSSADSSGQCFHEGIFYKDEAQWTSAKDPCTMCFCQNGVPQCDKMECPNIECKFDQIKRFVPDECCPVCMNVTENPEENSNNPQKCIFNGRSYSVGSKFRPFLIPNGFDTCTECFCAEEKLEINCTRTTEKSCCKNCNNDFSNNETYHSDDYVSSNNILPRKEVGKSDVDILAAGGCVNVNNPKKPYENGTTYHPVIDYLGEYKCVTCKCKNGEQTCKRQRCDKASCDKMLKLKRKGQPFNSSDFCCSFRECRKLYRHRKNHRSPNHTS